jgi:uncharacterized protein YegP (UPF0339 family)
VSIQAAGHSIVARIDLGQRLADVARYPDPRILRSTMQEGVGHHFARHDEGTVYVNVPFLAATELIGLRIRIADVTALAPGPMSPEGLADLFDAPPKKLGPIRELGIADLQASRDWAAVATTLGTRQQSGAFEIYTDKRGQYRWRLRRAGGEIVAVSGQGFVQRKDCEAELTWVRDNAAEVGVVSLDTPRPPETGSRISAQ